MNLDANTQRRIVIAVLAGALFLIVGYALFAFVAVLVFAVFLYYAVRPIFRSLERLPLGRRFRAMLSIILFGLPFLVLIAYAVAIVALELRELLNSGTTDRIVAELNIGGLDLESLETLVAGEQSEIDVDTVIDALLGATDIVGSVLIQLLLVVIIAYYMLVEGPRLVAWLLESYDESGTLRRYVEEVDPELSLALFGNIVNVFVTAIIAIVTFYLYNLAVPSTITVPFPALVGALAGIGSLIPVVGIKLVYVPVTVGLGANAWLADEPELFGPIVVLILVCGVVIDFIPDFVIRAQVSSDQTHTGMLLIAYIIGPAAFGFYGLFLAPILLICTTNAITVLLPYVVSGRTDGQTTLEEYAGNPEESE